MATDILGQDIRVTNFDIQFSSNQDFASVSDKENLKQAILFRLSTDKGEYFVTDYGSELFTVVGSSFDQLLKNRIIGYINESLLQEPRIASFDVIDVVYNDRNKEITCSISVLPVGETTTLNLVFPLFI